VQPSQVVSYEGGEEQGCEATSARSGRGPGSLELLLDVDRVYGALRVCALDVAVDVGAMLGNVAAVRTLKSRLLAALVSQVSVQAAVPLVGFPAVLAAVGLAVALAGVGSARTLPRARAEHPRGLAPWKGKFTNIRSLGMSLAQHVVICARPDARWWNYQLKCTLRVYPFLILAHSLSLSLSLTLSLTLSPSLSLSLSLSHPLSQDTFHVLLYYFFNTAYSQLCALRSFSTSSIFTHEYSKAIFSTIYC
jgi:hypothetical protein